MSTENSDKNQRAAGWMKVLKDCCEAREIKIGNNDEFRTIEQFYWLGIMQGIDAAGGSERDLIPKDIRALLLIDESPLVHLKPKQARVRKRKALGPHDVADPGHDMGASLPHNQAQQPPPPEAA